MSNQQKVWNTGVPKGTPVFGPGTQIDYPVDPELYRQYIPRQQSGSSASNAGALDVNAVPEILSDLSKRVGVNTIQGTIDVTLLATDLTGVDYYEVKIAKAK